MVSCNYVACRRTHIFKAYVNQLPPMHHPSQAHAYDSDIDGPTTIELPRKLVTYPVNPPLSVSSFPFPPLLGALFDEVYQGFIIYVGCGFHLARIHPSINQELSISWEALCFLGMKVYWTFRKMEAKNCVCWAGIWRVLTWDWSFPIKTAGSFL